MNSLSDWFNSPLQPARMLLALLFTVTAIEAADPNPADLSRRIDDRLGVRDVDESRLAYNTEFLRRLTLDLAGRIPTIAEVHDYHQNTSDTRRSDAVHRLMQSGVYYKNMSTFWRRSWLPQADTREFAGVADGFESWIGQRLRDGVPYNELVVEILTMDHQSTNVGKTTPVGFYDGNLFKPENLAASSTRAFLGINLDCAQCHNHPFARWTREQFWQTAAFFAAPGRDEQQMAKLPKVRIPDTELEYEPALLTREEAHFPTQLDSVGLRQVLVSWMQADTEKLMAKNAVNRLWAHFFGEAIIEPMDDLSRDEFQTGDRAELLNELADQFIASGYNLNFLVEGLVGSNAYRLSSTGVTSDVSLAAAATVEASEPYGSVAAPFRMMKATVRGLTGEQLYDSLQTAAGLPAERKDLPGAARGGRRDFTSVFYVERTYNAERSISQTLTLMNGSLVQELTSAKGNPMLASVLNSPFMTSEDQIDTIFIAVLGRHARDPELQAVRQNFEASPDAGREQQLGNLFWVLVNSAEFNINH